MSRAMRWPLSVLSLQALVLVPCARADEKPVKPVMEWRGTFLEKVAEPLIKEAPTSGCITDERTFGKLWLAWPKDKKERRLPNVDFEKQLVLVGTAPAAGTISLDLKLDEQGDLKGGFKATEKAGPGFAYMIAVIDRAGMKTYNGKAVAAGKTIKEGVDPDDASIVYDKPRGMISGFRVYNGKAYDRACLWVEPSVKLVLPDTAAEVRRHDQANVLLIFMEKRMHLGFHVREFVSIAERRTWMGCAVKLEKGALFIGSFGEFSFLEGSYRMKFLFLVPARVEVVRRAGLVGGPGGRSGSERSPQAINPEKKDLKAALKTAPKGRPDCRLPPTAEDGWYELPTVADVERRAEDKAGK